MGVNGCTFEQDASPKPELHGRMQPNAGGWDNGVGCRWQADDGTNAKGARRTQMSR